VPAAPLSFKEILKAAFWRPVRTRVLGAMPLTQMLLAAFGLAGFFNPGFWLLGLAALVALVGGRSASARFQKLVEGERLLARAQGWEERVQAAFARLTPDSRERYRRLLEQCGRILGIVPSLEGEGGGTLKDLRAGGLNQLLWLFLRLLGSRELILNNLSQTDRHAVEAELASVKERLAAAPAESPLARSLQATLDIQTRRLDNLTRAKTNLEVIDAELERIEQQVRLIREETAVSGGPEILSNRLDAVSSTLAETSRWMDQHADFFGSLAADEGAAEAAALPRLPEPPAPVEPPKPPPAPRARQRG
jgi:hypothetical protein